MNYTRQLPHEQTLVRLARHVSFPTTREELLRAASQHGYGASTILFLRLFDPGDIFENGVDFVNQCEELKLVLREKRQAPRELLHNPLD